MSIPDPVVLLDARARYVHPAITVERASTRSIWLPNSGERATVPINAIGWDVDPATGETLGALIERERTNRFTRSNQLDHGDWTKIGALDVTADGSWWRIAAATTETRSRAVHQSGGAITEDYHYAISFDVRFDDAPGVLARFDGGFGTTGDLRVYVDASGVQVASGDTDPSSLVSYDITPLRNGAYRVSVCARASANTPSSNAQIVLKDSYGSATSSTLSIGDGLWLRALQFEEVDLSNDPRLASSYIETDTASATRAHDTLALSDITDMPWFDANAGTFVIECRLPLPQVPGLRPLLVLGNAANNGLSVRNTTGTWSMVTRQGGPFLGGDFGSASEGITKIAVSYDFPNETASVSLNGASPNTWEIHNLTPAQVGLLEIGKGGLSGSGTANRRLNGWLKRLSYHSAPVSNADLQSLTALQE